MIITVFYKSTPLIPILNQMNPVRILPHYLPKNHYNIIFPSTHRSTV